MCPLPQRFLIISYMSLYVANIDFVQYDFV